jgi:transcriptional regulator with XRE-family HTH domain
MDLLILNLKREFERRLRTNPRYSLRSFARSLEIDVGSLSRIFNGKLHPGKKLSARLLTNIGMPPGKQKLLLSRDGEIKSAASRSHTNSVFHEIEDDQFRFLTDWYYYAILEALELKDFRDTYQWLGSRLGVSSLEAKLACERLQRLGFIKKVKGGWKDLTNGKTTSLNNQLTSSARREHQRGLLLKSIDTLETIAPEKRDHTSMTMAIDVADVENVRKLIKDFRRKLSGYLNQASEKSEVYNMSVSFFPLSIPKETKSP